MYIRTRSMLHRQDRLMNIIDLTLVLNIKTGTWQVEDGADTDRGDPLAEACTERQQVQRAQEHQRYQLGVHYKVAIRLKSKFRKRNAQEDDYDYEAAELLDTREKCTAEHEHCEPCFQTLYMRFSESRRETWVNPSRNRCIPVF